MLLYDIETLYYNLIQNSFNYTSHIYLILTDQTYNETIVGIETIYVIL